VSRAAGKAVVVSGLGKSYRVGRRGFRPNTVVEAATERLRHPLRRTVYEEFRALDDVSFEVPWGEAVGIVGRNGAGKSTLLKLLTRITAPTRGRIELSGRIGSLLEVGTGFHPELTGRENIFLSGSLLGMNRGEIRRQFESIVEFSGVEKFLDTPVKRYSSGMYVRLAFSVAAHLETEILAIDEVLAVGDAEFQIKCVKRIQELRDQGITSLFISHDLTAVERLCDSAILLEGGKIAATGAPGDVVAAYHRRLALWDPGSGETTLDSPKSGVAVMNVSLRSPNEPNAVAFSTGAPLTVAVRYAVARPVDNVEFELRYYSSDGKTRLAAPRTGGGPQPLNLRPPGGIVEFHCPALPLNRGSYSVGAIVRDLITAKTLAWWDGGTRLYVSDGPATDAQLFIPHSWRLIHADDGTGVVNDDAPPPAV
jgi:ABC-type polysaccharide/polyol phosphate transport system ATPase subunit